MKALNIQIILKVIGFLLIVESIGMLLCLFASSYYSLDYTPLLYSGLITAGVGSLLFLLFYNTPRKIAKRESFIIVSVIWIILAAFGSLPFLLSGYFPNYTHAFFEALSGFTTTGSTVLTNVEIVPKDILLWRSLMQWIGGIAVIVFALAIIPILGMGNLQMYASEIYGPTNDKINPRVIEITKQLLGIYFVITIAEIVLLMFGSLSFFDALNFSFSTISTGGFSIYNSNLLQVSPYIQYVIAIFMAIAGINFTVLYFGISGRYTLVWKNEEFRRYIFIVFFFISIIFLILYLSHNIFEIHLSEIEQIGRDSIFQVISIITTTGFYTTNFLLWPKYAIMICFIIMFLGASSGTASGGFKTVRFAIIIKQSFLEFKRLIHPNAIVPLQLHNKPVNDTIIKNVFAFVGLYILTFVFGVLALTLLNHDFDTSIGAVISSLSNISYGIGNVGPTGNFSAISDYGKIVLSFLMICGRVELFTILVLFTSAFWKK